MCIRDSLFPVLLIDTKIPSLLDTVHYHTILLTFERILDIQRELCYLMTLLRKKTRRDVSLRKMAECYDFSSSTVQKALSNLGDEKALLNILGTHETLKEFVPYGLASINENEPPEAVSDYVSHLKEVRRQAMELKGLPCVITLDMAGKIHGTMGLASNIAQAAMNILGASRISRVVQKKEEKGS